MLRVVYTPYEHIELRTEALRTSLGKTAEGTKGQLAKWVFRKFITFDSQTGLYTKTEEYLRNA